MLSIRPSNVPEYLKYSAFFANLGNDDDNEVNVPKDCCKLDTSVTTSAELEELLRTLRFWGVEKIPETAVRYMFFKSKVVLESHYIDRFVRDLPCVAQLMQVLTCERKQQLCEAAKLENVSMVSCLLKQQKSSDYDRYSDFEESCRRAALVAAEKGCLDILQVMSENNCSFFIESAYAAARSGHTECLKFVVGNGCEVGYDLVNYAFASGNIDCLNYVHGHLGCPWTSCLFRELSFSNLTVPCDEDQLMQCLEYAQILSCPVDKKACLACVRHNWPKLLQYLHDNGWPWDEDIIAEAIKLSHLHCLKYAAEHGCPLPARAMHKAMISGSVEIIEYLNHRGLSWPEQPMYHLLHGGKADAEKVIICLLHAYKLGCPRDPQICIIASTYGWLDLLIDGCEHGMKWSTYCTQQAAGNGHLHCLMYLHENGCPWDEETTLSAQTARHFDCLDYAVEHGCLVVSDAHALPAFKRVNL